MDKVNLSREGFPNYDLYCNGNVTNLETGATRGNMRFVGLTYNGTSRTFSVPLLLRRYFGNELNSLPKNEVVNLKFMGYPDYEVTADGRLWSHKTEQWYEAQAVNSTGYITVGLSNDKGKKSFKLHRIVAMAFVPNPNHYDQIDHKDGVKIHNAAWNLEWVSGVENARRAREKGLKPMAVTEKEIRRACEMISTGKYTDTEIAKACNTYSAIIYHIRNGHTHCEIAQEYGIKPNRIHGRKIDYSLYKKHHQNYKTYTPKKDKDV